MLRRGDIVLVIVKGDYGKVRPAVIIQSDLSLHNAQSVSVCLMTSDLDPDSPIRIDVSPDADNGLRKLSQIQPDKIQTIRLEKVREKIGVLDHNKVLMLDNALALHLNLYASEMPGADQ